MPAKPIAPISSACHTGNRLKARSSSSGRSRAPVSTACGRAKAISETVTSETSDTAAKVQRQLASCPIQVASGVPTRIARVRPSITRLTARPRASGRLIDTAVSAATPKYAPCGRPAMKRNSSRLP